MGKAALIALTLAALPAWCPAQTGPKTWEALQSLAGDWLGEGEGQPGKGAGGFSFTSELQGKALVRRNWAEYPATPDRAAFRHDDLMIVYRQGESVRADYYDNEGHVIRYSVDAPADRIVFAGDVEPRAPRFRLTYHRIASGRVAIKFEIAPPGKPEQFSVYIEATARRK